MDKKYTVNETAKKLKVSGKTILREIKKGKLESDRVGRRILISEGMINNYLRGSNIELGKSLKRFIEGKKSEMVDLLQKMVSLPSVGYGQNCEYDLAKFIYRKLQDFGIRSVLLREGGSVAVRASFGYADEGFLINSPLDTAPIGNPDNWKYPPFAGVIKAGKMYGRGVADCKAGIVSAIYALLALKNIYPEEKMRLELVFDGGEQDGSYNGMQMVLKRGLHADCAIIGYAGDEFDLAIGCRGYHRYTFKTLGKSAHTGARYNHGINAIRSMVDFIGEMYRLNLPESKNQYFPFGQKVTFSVIEGGSVINVVPDECTAKLDVRITPDFSRSYVDKKIAGVIKKLNKRDKRFLIDWNYDVGNEGYNISDKEKIVVSTSEAVSRVYSRKARLVASGPSHIGTLLNGKGIASVVWGPRGGNVHSYDEYVGVDSLSATARVYSLAVLNYFGVK